MQQQIRLWTLTNGPAIPVQQPVWHCNSKLASCTEATFAVHKSYQHTLPSNPMWPRDTPLMWDSAKPPQRLHAAEITAASANHCSCVNDWQHSEQQPWAVWQLQVPCKAASNKQLQQAVVSILTDQTKLPKIRAFCVLCLQTPFSGSHVWAVF